MKQELHNLLNFVNPTDLKVLANNYFVIQDHAGWTNGFIADLTDKNASHFEAVAKLKPNIVTRCVTDKDRAPKIAKLLEFTELYKVEGIELSLENGFIKLTTDKVENKETYMNPIYLAYFVKNYGSDITLELQENKYLSVVVKNIDGDVIGLIMPVRVG
jgi:hypothetical protein